MYEIIYSKDGEELSIKYGNKSIPFDEKNRDYIQYLKDVENGIEVIDEPPTANEIAKANALYELQKADQEVIKNIARVIEDYYDTMPDDQKALMYDGFKNAIADKKIKRKAYTDLL